MKHPVSPVQAQVSQNSSYVTIEVVREISVAFVITAQICSIEFRSHELGVRALT